jgi:hypothetical protein
MRFAGHDGRLRALESRAERSTMRIKISAPFDPAAAAAMPPPIRTVLPGGVVSYSSAKSQAGGLPEGATRDPTTGHVLLTASQAPELTLSAEDRAKLRAAGVNLPF